MKNYILTRILKSIFSIFVVLSIVIVMLYTMIPTSSIFLNDDGYRKLTGNAKIVYRYNKLEDLGYGEFKNLNDMCDSATDKEACLVFDSNENKEVLKHYEDLGYTIDLLNREGDIPKQNYAYRDYNIVELLLNFYSSFIVIDHPNKIQDENNPSLERNYSFDRTPNGGLAITCSGCVSKYQLYTDTKFPFLHQNIIELNFGKSYPTNQGVDTLEVISKGQGTFDKVEQTFPTGEVIDSPIDQLTCKYKPEPDHLDAKRFDDNYANCLMYYESPSMISTSYIFGVISVVLGYIIAIPFAVIMARKRGKLFDKIGTVYINLLIALPSLAFILIMKYLGSFATLPDKFPQYGFNDVRSYILPILILALLNTPGIMMWLRRYMIDQSNADYIKFAKAKGLSDKEIYQNHILRNAIIPIVNGIPGSIILAISGAVITETVFAIPGMGKMLPDSIKATNNNMVITLVFIFTTLAILSVLLGDILMTKVDPRIKLTKKENE